MTGPCGQNRNGSTRQPRVTPTSARRSVCADHHNDASTSTKREPCAPRRVGPVEHPHQPHRHHPARQRLTRTEQPTAAQRALKHPRRPQRRHRRPMHPRHIREPAHPRRPHRLRLRPHRHSHRHNQHNNRHNRYLPLSPAQPNRKRKPPTTVNNQPPQPTSTTRRHHLAGPPSDAPTPPCRPSERRMRTASLGDAAWPDGSYLSAGSSRAAWRERVTDSRAWRPLPPRGRGRL